MSAEEAPVPAFRPGEQVRLRVGWGPAMVVDICPDPDIEDMTVVFWFDRDMRVQSASFRTALLDRVPEGVQVR